MTYQLRDWDQVLLESLKQPEAAFSLLASYAEDAQSGEMVEILDKVIQVNPALSPLVIPMYAKYLTALELNWLQSQHPQAAAFIEQYKALLLHVLAS